MPDDEPEMTLMERFDHVNSLLRMRDAAPMPDPTTEAERTCTDAPGCPCGCVSDVQAALSTLDDLTADFGPLPAEDIDALDDWANNIQLDIMRHRRLRKAPESPADAPTPVTAATEAHGEAGGAQEGPQ
jgi:hypothetical protein